MTLEDSSPPQPTVDDFSSLQPFEFIIFVLSSIGILKDSKQLQQDSSPSGSSDEGRVTELGVICPSVNITFGLKRVNNVKIWFLLQCSISHFDS